MVATTLTATKSKAFSPKSAHGIYANLVLRLYLAAERHTPTVAGILGVTSSAVGARLKRRGIRQQFLRARSKERPDAWRASHLRAWWRKRMRAIGIDPASLPVTDPAWSACHAYPRGHYVRVVAGEMRAELGIVLGSPFTPEQIETLLARVAERKRLGPASVALPTAGETYVTAIEGEAVDV